mmetsp:Transcript_2003/g.4947  ORF Transcript_2003/g.4947 Transcript_2003/m.4947 type:complete len:330 (-) Transcript_2003:3298-4287(-)
MSRCDVIWFLRFKDRTKFAMTWFAISAFDRQENIRFSFSFGGERLQRLFTATRTSCKAFCISSICAFSSRISLLLLLLRDEPAPNNQPLNTTSPSIVPAPNRKLLSTGSMSTTLLIDDKIPPPPPMATADRLDRAALSPMSSPPCSAPSSSTPDSSALLLLLPSFGGASAPRARLASSNSRSCTGVVSVIVPVLIWFASRVFFRNSTWMPTSTFKSLSPSRRAAHLACTEKQSEYGMPSKVSAMATTHLSLPSTRQYCAWLTCATDGPMYRCVFLLNLKETCRFWEYDSPHHADLNGVASSMLLSPSAAATSHLPTLMSKHSSLFRKPS